MNNNIFRKILIIVIFLISPAPFFSPLLSNEKKDPLLENLYLKAMAAIRHGWDFEALKQSSFLKNAGAKGFAFEIESRVYLKNRKYHKAINSCKYLYESEKSNIRHLNNLLQCYLKTARFDEARGLLLEGIQTFPYNTDLLLKLADLMENTKNYQGAFPYLLCARKISPHNKKVALNTGLAYHKLNKDELALHFFREALQIDPDDVWIKNYIGIINEKRKRKNPDLEPGSVTRENNTAQAQVITSAVAKPESFADMEREIFHSIYKGDQPGLYKNIEKLLLKYPDEPESFLYYHEIYNYAQFFGFDRAAKILFNIMNSVDNKKNFAGKNLCILYLKLELEKLLYDYGKSDGKKISMELSPLRRWVLIGPYLKYGAGDMEHSFIPEIVTNLKNSGIKKKEIQIQDAGGELDLGRYIYPEKGIIYAATTINCDQPFKIRIYSNSSYKLFINGKEVLKNLKSGIFRNCRIVKIWDSPRTTFMLKFLKNENETSSRVLITDTNDKMINASGDTDLVFSNFNYSEEADYPYSFFIGFLSDDEHGNDIDVNFRLARFFERLGSRESLKYYKKAISSNNHLIMFFYAQYLFNENQNCNEFTLEMENRNIIENLCRDYPDFIPARQLRLKRIIKISALNEAYPEYQKILLNGRGYLPLRLDYATLLLRNSYEKEFEEEAGLIIKEFPEAVQPLILLSEYYRERNISRCIDINKEILLKNNSRSALTTLIDIYHEQGNYEEIKRLIDASGTENLFIKKYIGALIDAEDYKTARKALFLEILNKEDPDYYAVLGEINYLQGLDPVMYWQKALSIRPSNYILRDFLNYFERGRIENLSDAYRDTEISGELLKISTGKANRPSREVNRSVVFLLYPDGGSRMFCEDLIYIADDTGVNKYKNYPVPFGKIHPVWIRIYNKNGSYNDSFKINSDNSILPGTLSAGTTVYANYYMDNPVKKPEGSAFFAIPYLKTHLPALSRIILKVIAPQELPLRFSFNREQEVKSVTTPDGVIYTAEIDNRSGTGEVKPGEQYDTLYFSFSNMNNLKDLIIWYTGILQETNNTDSAVKNQFPGKTARELVESVYYYVNNNIKQQNKSLFFPKKAMDTFNMKQGSSEDKSILAYSILTDMGIKSYIALTAGQDFFNDASFISPYIFTDVLLYVPFDVKTGLWLDFSDRNFDCGAVDNKLNGRDSVVIIKDNYEIKKIMGTQ